MRRGLAVSLSLCRIEEDETIPRITAIRVLASNNPGMEARSHGDETDLLVIEGQG